MGIVETVLRALGLTGNDPGSGTDAGAGSKASGKELPAEDGPGPDADDPSTDEEGWIDPGDESLPELRNALTAADRRTRWGAVAAAVERIRSGELPDDALVSRLLDDVETETPEPPAVVLGTVAERSPAAVAPHADRLVDLLHDHDEHVREHLVAALTHLPPDAVPVEPLIETVHDDERTRAVPAVSSVLGRVAVGTPERVPVDRLRDGGAGPRPKAEATAYLRLLLHAAGADPGTRPAADFETASSAELGTSESSEAAPGDGGDGRDGDDESESGRLRGIDEFVARRLDAGRIRRFLDERTGANCVDFDVARTPMGVQMVVYTDPLPDRPDEFAATVAERFDAQVDVQEP